MRLISSEAICRNYTPIILWLQEVEEQVRTSYGVKAGVFLRTIRKFNTCFYVEVLRIVFSIVKSAMTLLQNAQLNFCKTQDNIACTKASTISAGNDDRFDSVLSIILSATETKNVIDDSGLSRPQ